MGLTDLLPWYVRWGAVALLALACAGFGAFEMHEFDQGKYEVLEGKHENLKTAVTLANDAAKAEAARYEKLKEQIDVTYDKAVADYNADLRRMRDNRAAGGGLAAKAGAPEGADRTCFDPALLAAALRRLDEGVLGLLGEGQKAEVDLDSGKAWGQAL